MPKHRFPLRTLALTLILLTITVGIGGWLLERYVHQQIDTSVRQALSQTAGLSVTGLQINAGPTPLADNVLIQKEIPQLHLQADHLDYQHGDTTLHLQNVSVHAHQVQVLTPNQIGELTLGGTMSSTDFSALLASQNLPAQITLENGQLQVSSRHQLMTLRAHADLTANPTRNSAHLQLREIKLHTALGETKITPQQMRQLNLPDSYDFDLSNVLPTSLTVTNITLAKDHLHFTFSGQNVDPTQLTSPTNTP